MAVVAEIVRRTLSRESHVVTEPGQPPFAALVAGAALGFTVEMATLAASTAVRTVRTLGPWGSWFFSASGAERFTRLLVERFNDRWQEVSPEAQEAATAFARELVPELTRAFLDQIDLNALVDERVDLDVLASDLDLEAIIGRIDLDRVVARVDVGAIVDRLDLDAIAARIDPDAIVARVDLDAAVRRVDAVRLAREVIEELDMLALIRESTEGVTTEAVDDLRYGAVGADRAIARVVDRIFRRHDRAEDAPDQRSGGSETTP
jgi:hypothetical protein